MQLSYQRAPKIEAELALERRLTRADWFWVMRLRFQHILRCGGWGFGVIEDFHREEEAHEGME